jgi:chemotaxis protein CheD
LTVGAATRPPARLDPRPGTGTGPETASPTAYVYPGQLNVTRGPGVLVTILGSCVAVCLHDAHLGLGGMNHYLLPTRGAEADQPGRYGPSAIDRLMAAMLARGASRDRLVAHVIGGASVLAAYTDAEHLGLRNATVAQEVLAAHGVPVAGLDIGGTRGRKVQFSPHDGQVAVRIIGA